MVVPNTSFKPESIDLRPSRPPGVLCALNVDADPYTALYTVKPPLYRLYSGKSSRRLAYVVNSVFTYTAYTQYSVYSIQRYTPSLGLAAQLALSLLHASAAANGLPR